MAEIKFYANETSIAGGADSTVIQHAAGSGLGFFGGGFGISVAVAAYQDTTYVTNSDGTSSGIRVKNTKWIVDASNPNSGCSANSVNIGLSGMPNYYAPLNIKFTHTDAVKVQNCKLRIFDRNDISKQASGVTTKVFECRHPHPLPAHAFASYSGSGTLAHRGTGKTDFQWTEFDPTEAMADMVFTSSPGLSGLNTVAGETLPTGDSTGMNWLTNEGVAHQSLTHDWYVSLSASPDSIGSKTQYGLYFTLEYL